MWYVFVSHDWFKPLFYLCSLNKSLTLKEKKDLLKTQNSKRNTSEMKWRHHLQQCCLLFGLQLGLFLLFGQVLCRERLEEGKTSTEVLQAGLWAPARVGHHGENAGWGDRGPFGTQAQTVQHLGGGGEVLILESNLNHIRLSTEDGALSTNIIKRNVSSLWMHFRLTIFLVKSSN